MKKVPKSKAKTAFDLLSDVAALALAEPRRIHMNFWRLTSTDTNVSAVVPQGFPACGTVGCIGGWTEQIARGRKRDAEVILGLTHAQRMELFYPKALLADAGSAREAGNAQTPKHAERVVAHIRAFQQKYADQLKAKAV
jgi:hypothetical protein